MSDQKYILAETVCVHSQQEAFFQRGSFVLSLSCWSALNNVFK